MSGSMNKAQIIGHLGQDPDIRSTQSGERIANLSIATSESWKDKTTGERRQRTQWHRVVIFNQGLVSVADQYLKKGAKIYIEGQIETRKWADQSGQEKYTTEIVLRPYRGELIMLDTRGGNAPPPHDGMGANGDGNTPYGTTPPAGGQSTAPRDAFEDEIPFY